MALQLATQVADMPTVKNSKYGKYAKKGVNGLNKFKDFAAKQKGSRLACSLRHVGQTGRAIILGKNSPFKDIPIIGDIFRGSNTLLFCSLKLTLYLNSI